MLLESGLTIVNALSGLATFILLAAWTNSYLTTANLYTALTFYFIFALFHSATPLLLQRVRKIHAPRIAVLNEKNEVLRYEGDESAPSLRIVGE